MLLGRVCSHLQNNSGNVPQVLLSRYFREELNRGCTGRPVRERPHRVLLSYKIKLEYSASKESACNAGDLGSIPGSGRSPGEGNGNPLQYSRLENSKDRGYSPWGREELDMTE